MHENIDIFIPNKEAMEELGIQQAQFGIDLKILRELRDRGEISPDFDNYPRDRAISLTALAILRRYRELVRQAGVRHAVNQIRKEYGNQCEQGSGQ